MDPAWLVFPVVALLVVGGVRLQRWLSDYWARRRAAARGVVLLPVEEIAREARRLAPVVHHPPRGMSFVKFEARRHHYDRLLAAACAALDVEHLLDVLEPGPELDRERDRVETRLWLLGLRIDEVA